MTPSAAPSCRRRCTGTNRRPCGRPCSPRTSTGVDGPASFTSCAFSSNMRADFAVDSAGDEVVADLEAFRSEPARSRRFRGLCRSWLRERFPLQAGAGSAFRFCRSATSRIISSSSSRFLPVLAETSTVDGVAAPVFSLQALFGEFALDALRIHARLIDLVDRDDNRNFGGPRVRNRFDRLRHDAVIGSDDQHHDVRDLRAACAHERERFVTRRIEEGDLAVLAPSPGTRRCAA